MRCWQQLLNFLVAGCLAQLHCGNIFIFPVYMNALKEFLQINQHQVELWGGVLSSSFALGLPAAIFLRTFGPEPTLIVGMLINFSGYISAWAVKFINHESYFSFPVQLASAIAIGHGASYTYVASLVTTCECFGDKHHGKVISFLEAVLCGSPAITQQIYFTFFVNGDYGNYNNHNVFQFMLFNAVFSVIINGLAIICVLIGDRTKVSNVDGERDNQSYADKEQQHLLMVPVQGQENNTLDILKTANAHLLFWTTVLVIGITEFNEYNISVFAETLQYNRQFQDVFICYHSCVFLSCIIVGFLTDALAQNVSCMVYVSVVSNVAGISFGLSYAMHLSLTHFYIFLIIMGAMHGVSRSPSAVTIKKRFGDSLFASAWTVFTFCGGCFTLISQQIFSILYQAKIPDNSNTCYGQTCLDIVFILLSAFSFLVGLLSAILTIRGY